MECVDTISEVATKELPARDGKPALTLYLLKDSEGREYSTRDRSLAQAAQAASLNGVHVHMEYEEKSAGDYGQFTRRYLSSLNVVDEPLGPVGQQVRQAQAIATSGRPDPFEDTIPEQPTVAARSISDLDKQHLIVNQSSLKVAIEALQYLPEEERTVSNSVTAAEYYATWVWSFRPKVQS